MVVAFPTGDAQAKMVSRHQSVTLAAMEGSFQGGRLAEVTIIGQPNVEEQRLENPIPLPGALSFWLTERSRATSKDSTSFHAKAGRTTSN